MADSWIVSGRRTPIGKFLGDLASLSAPQLGAQAIRATLESIGASLSELDEVVMGQVLPAGSGQAPARQATLLAGIPSTVPSVTINKVCGSGMYALLMADRGIRSGDLGMVVAGGMESMSQAPHYLRRARSGWKYGDQPLLDAIDWDGLRCAHGKVLMGEYAEQVAQRFQIDRQAQDAWSLQSHQRALQMKSQTSDRSSIVAIDVPGGRKRSDDELPRADSSMEKLNQLPSAFLERGTVTAGNASPLSDGAAAMLVVDQEMLPRVAKGPAFRILETAISAGDPKDLFLAPVAAIRKLLERANLKIEEVGLFEINEAFAVQTIACMRALNIDPEKLNVMGGAIALGHPIGCSGARIVVTLMEAMQCYGTSLGIAAACLGGGEAVAILLEMQG